MCSLQQVKFQYVDSADTVGADTDKVIVAIHRRSGIAVSYLVGYCFFEFFQCKQWNDLRWNALGCWKASDNLERVMAVCPVESLDVIAFVGTSNRGSCIAFVGFDGSLRAVVPISTEGGVVAADFNQKSREFVVAYESGIVAILVLKVIDGHEYNLAKRRSSKFASGTGENAIVQVVTQDLIGSVLLLSGRGHILSVTMDRFDVVYSISSDLFSLKPSKLIVDKFGIDFAVLCTSAETLKQQLEYWRPPDDYTTCRENLFGRISIPLSSRFINAAFETVGLFDAKSLLAVTTLNKKLQLWTVSGDGSMLCTSELRLNSPSSLWQGMQHVVDSKCWENDVFYPGLSVQANTQSFVPMPKLQDLTYKSMMLSALGKSTTFIGIHSTDEIEHTMGLVFMDLEIKRVQQKQPLPMRSTAMKGEFDADAYISEVTEHQFSHEIEESGLNKDEDVDMIAPVPLLSMTDSISFTQPPPVKHMKEVDSNVADENQLSSRSMETTSDLSERSPHNDNVTGGDALHQTRLELALVDKKLNSDNIDDNKLNYALNEEHHNQTEVENRADSRLPSSRSQLMHKLARDMQFPSFAARSNRNKEMFEVSTSFFYPGYLASEQKDVAQSAALCYNNRGQQSGSADQIAATGMSHRIVLPNNVLVDEQSDLLTFNNSGLQRIDESHVSLAADILSIRSMSFAFRRRHVLIVTEVRDCMLFDLKALNRPPLRIPINLRFQAQITSITLCDAIIKSPTLSSKDRSKKGSTKALTDLDKTLSIALIGDDQGFLHYFLCDGSERILQHDSFRAHSTRVSHILATGDCTRPLWVLNTEFSDQGLNVLPVASAGAAIVSVSSDGEFKTWIPFCKESRGTTLDRVGFGVPIHWKLSGLFSVKSTGSTAPINDYGESFTVLATSKKAIRTLECVSLLPSCLNVLVGFTSGLLEEWHIPGLLDAQDATLVTSQRPFWSTYLHSAAVCSLRVHVHSALSSIREVPLVNETNDRDKIIAGLASFVRVSSRVKVTAGITFQESKVLSSCSAMVSCSSDRSLVLWTFQASFFSYCTFLHPTPCRKFCFSSTPWHGLAFCVHAPQLNASSPQSVWRVDTLLDGRLITVACDFSGKIFHQTSAFALDDYRLTLSGQTFMVVFDDDEDNATNIRSLLPSTPSTAQRRALRQSLTTIPVFAKVGKASALVGAYSQTREAFAPAKTRGGASFDKSSSSYPFLFSSLTLEDWARIKDVSVPIVAQLGEDGEEDAVMKADFAASSSKMATTLSRPKSPSSLQITFSATDQETKEKTSNVTHPDDTGEASVKFEHGGIRMEAKKEFLESTISKLNNIVDARFVVDRNMPLDSLISVETPSSISSLQNETLPRRVMEFPEVVEPPAMAINTVSIISFSDDISSTPATREAKSRAVHTQDEAQSQAIPALYALDEAEKPIQLLEGEKLEATVSIITEESVDEAIKKSTPKGKFDVYKTKATELREKQVAKQKERLDLLDNVQTRKAAKAQYVSKTSMLNEDNKKFQGGTRQHLGSSSMFAPSPHSGSRSNFVVTAGTVDAKAPSVQPLRPSHSTLTICAPGQLRDLLEPAVPLTDHDSKAPNTALETGLDKPMVVTVVTEEPRPTVTDAKVSVDTKYAHISEGKPKFVVNKKAHLRMTQGNHRISSFAMDLRKDNLDEAHSESLHTDSHFMDDEVSTVSLQSEALTNQEPYQLVLPSSPTGVLPQQTPKQQQQQQQQQQHQKQPQQHTLEKKVPTISHRDAIIKQKTLSKKKSDLIGRDIDGDVSDLVSEASSDAGSQANAQLLHTDKQRMVAPIPGKHEVILDLPDLGKARRRRHAIQLVKGLTDRGVALNNTPLENVAEALKSNPSSTPLELAEASIDALLSDEEDSLVTSYFDRNAKPIFVERKKARRTIVDGKHKTTAAEDDDDASTATAVSQSEKELAAFAQGISDEDRLLFEALSEEDQKKLMMQMKNGKSNPKLLKQLTMKMLSDGREAALLNMDLTLDCTKQADVTFSVNVTSESGGSVYVVLLDEVEQGSIARENFANEVTLTMLPGYREHRVLTLAAGDSQELTFQSLRPTHHYVVIGVINLMSLEPVPVSDNKSPINSKKSGKSMRKSVMVDTSKIASWWSLPVVTTDEMFDVEWSRLDQDMRLMELRAAIRSEFVQAKAYFHFPCIVLPSDEDFKNAEFLALLDPRLDKKARLAVKQRVPELLRVFYDWWVGDEDSRAATVIRSDFQSLECIHAILNHPTVMQQFVSERFGSEDECHILCDYVQRFLNFQKRGVTMTSSTFQDSLCSGAIADVSRAGIPATATTPTATAEPVVDSFSVKKSQSSKVNALTIEELNSLGLNVMKKFRSWYKGGLAVSELLHPLAYMERADDEVSLASNGNNSCFSDSAELLNITPELKLQHRNAFLTHLVERLISSNDLVTALFEKYKIAVARGLRESDLLYERSSLSTDDVQTIMAAKKFLELCFDQGMFSEEIEQTLTEKTWNSRNNRNETPCYRTIELKTLDAFEILVEANPSLALMNQKGSKSICPTFVVLLRLTGGDIFREANDAHLKADDAPPVTIRCLPGTQRRPLRPWQLMSPADQDLELCLAVNLDSIWELAIIDCVEIPSCEDRLLDKNQYPLRHRYWSEFREWYAGEEETNKIPGDGVPTLARVVFAEQFETKQVQSDVLIVRVMTDNQLPLPQSLTDSSIQEAALSATMAVAERGSDSNLSETLEQTSVASQKTSTSSSRKLSLAERRSRRTSAAGECSTILQAYQRAINTNKGSFLRTLLISKALNELFKAQKINMLKYVWPSLLTSRSGMFLFPSVGLRLPLFSLPLRRYLLFGSRSKDRYNMEEMLRWYSTQQLDEDDLLMRKSEAKGAKMRAYLDWLAMEPERRAQTRLDMMQEDRDAAERRHRDAILQERLTKMQKVFQDLDLQLDAASSNNADDDPALAFLRELTPSSPNGSSNNQLQFRFGSKLPAEYWYIFEESVEYKHSNGLFNEDEVEEMQEEQREVARKAVADARAFEQSLNEGKKKREMEERMKAQREEKDRRLKEGVARRRHIRENLEELKRQRLIRQEEEMLAKLEELEEAQRKAESEERERLRLKAIEDAEQSRLRELHLMACEELRGREILVGRKELRLMEQEDIFSFLREQLELKKAINDEERMMELASIYQPFEPYDFQHTRIKRPALHNILKDVKEVAKETQFLDDVRTSLHRIPNRFEAEDETDDDVTIGSKASSRCDASYLQIARLQTTETVSSSKNRSKRYEILYGEHSRPSEEIENIIQSRTISPSKPTSPYDLDEYRSISRPRTGNNLIYREKDYSPTKKNIRDLVSDMIDREGPLPYDPYENQWQLHGQDPSRSAFASSTLPSQSLKVSIDVSAPTSPHQPRDPLAEISWLQSASISSTIFNPSQSLEQESQMSPGKSRQKLKKLLSLSADVIAKSGQQQWLDHVALQQKLTMASLSSLDAADHVREANPILASIKAQQRAQILAQEDGAPKEEAPTKKAAKPTKSAKKDALMSHTLPTELSLLDAKTKRMGKSASDAVINIQKQREAMRQYVSGSAILGDNYFLQACQPGIRSVTSLETNDNIRKFAQQIQEQLEKEAENLPDPSLDKPIPVSSGPVVKKKPPPLISQSKVNPPLPTRVVPAKSAAVSANPFGAIMGTTMKIEEDRKRGKLKPVKSAMSASLPLQGEEHPLLKPNPSLSAEHSLDGVPLTAGRSMRSIELALFAPPPEPNLERRQSFGSLDSKPLPPISR